MIDLTWTNGQKIQIDGKDVLRIRPTYPQIDGPKGRSRVVWLQFDIFEEEAAWVATAVIKELPTLAKVIAPDGNPVWFNGVQSTGPVFVPPANRGDGVNSSLSIGGNLQFVQNTPEEVAGIIKASGGKVLPIRKEIPSSFVLDDFKTWIKNEKVWDIDVLKLTTPKLIM